MEVKAGRWKWKVEMESGKGSAVFYRSTDGEFGTRFRSKVPASTPARTSPCEKSCSQKAVSCELVLILVMLY